ncbi:chemotaxis protein CheD [Dongia sp.]|uniref:chemotaxis protein CheD n=1 Tax=Dongia sp. TaxID=1977262 RepID=UPI0037500D99
MALAEPDIRKVFLSPGDVICRAEPTLVTTVLGSCVSVTLWDKDRRIGGLNHFVLPKGGAGARYGETAMLELLEGVLDLGAHLRSLEAKVFGGAAVLPVGGEGTVGSNNVAFALGELARRGIPVAGRRTGGERGRLLVFNTGTGEAFVRWLAEHEKLPAAS